MTMGYDPNRQQPASMKVDRVGNPADKIVDYVYNYYDANGKNNGRIRKIFDNTDSAYTTTYVYDDYRRLQSATAGAYSRNYQYDAWGNITNFAGITLSYQLNGSGAPATNRLSNDSQGINYSYDQAGNMTQAGSATYSYDGANRLKTAGGGASTYGYDGDGKRVRVTDGGAAVFYVYSSKLGQVAMEVNSSGVRRAYVYVGGKQVAQQSVDGQFYWLHTNHLGNSRAMTDVNGNLVYKGQFDPYGQALLEWGSASLNTKKFTGYERDGATGLDYAGARMYNPGRGRFMQPDPAGLEAAELKRPKSLNRYAYVENDPVNFNDPEGLFLGAPWCTEIYWDGLLMGNTCGGGYWMLLDGPWLMGPIPAPEPDPEPVLTNCKIELWSRPLDYKGGDYNPINWAHHMFITTQVVSNDPALHQETPKVFQGLHVGDLILAAGGFDFKPGNEDYDLSRTDAAIHVALWLPGNCDEVNQSFHDTVYKINQKKLKYEVGIPNVLTNVNNSNSVAYTILDRWNSGYRTILGAMFFATARTPPQGFVPGWGHRMPIG